MGDWSDKLDYEYREYYGHLYDPDREEDTEEEDTPSEISKERYKEIYDRLKGGE